MSITILQMRPIPDEPTYTKARNDTNSRAIVRKRLPRIYLPHRSMPKRGPKGKLGYQRLFNLIVWVLYTGMQWKCLPIPTDAQGKPAIHYTTVYRAFATWADDGSLWQAFVASVRHLAVEKQLDLSVLHGDGTNTVAKKGAMALASRATNTRKARRSSL